jgi:Zn finger protein HypA/HybF involved in hydrogenase expression
VDILERSVLNFEQLKKLKVFLIEMKPLDHELMVLTFTIDTKINKAEENIAALKLTRMNHICGLCQRGYNEEVTKMIGTLKICPICQGQGGKFILTSDLEKKHNLPKGTIKRDCMSLGSKPPVLQQYFDCGLIYYSGTHHYAHEVLIQLYYSNPEEYKRRKSRTKQSQ